MMETHYDDEALISFLERDVVNDQHLTSCGSCSQSLEEYRAIARALGEDAVWDLKRLREEPPPAIAASVVAFEQRLEHEDEEGDWLLRELSRTPRESWPRFAERSEFHTVGCVQQLLAASEDTEVLPADELSYTQLAVGLAEQIDPAAYPGDTVRLLRGMAWREYAFALYYVGDIVDAQEAARRARGHVEQCASAAYENARLNLMEALICRHLEQFDEALRLTGEALATLQQYGDRNRVARALATRAYIYAGAAAWKEALEITDEILRDFGTDVDPRTQALLVANCGVYAREVGDTNRALEQFRLASAIYDTLGLPGEAARNRWNVAVTLKTLGQWRRASDGLEHVYSEFEKLEMPGVAAMVALDLAELRLMEGDNRAVIELAQQAMGQFQRSGLAYTSRAMIALAFLREATESGRVSLTAVDEVRRYLQRLPSEPTLQFAYLPREE